MNISKFQAIEYAKEKINQEYPGNITRPWVELKKETPDKNDTLTFLFRHGTPPKGYIIVNHGNARVIAFGNRDDKLGAWHYDENMTDESTTLCTFCNMLDGSKSGCGYCVTRNRDFETEAWVR